MERYYITLKNERIYIHYCHTDEELYSSIEESAYVTYPHTCIAGGFLKDCHTIKKRKQTEIESASVFYLTIVFSTRFPVAAASSG